jgi:MFS family permease
MRTHGRFAALHYRDFRLFWAGQLISFSGTWMQQTALGWLVYDLTHSPLYLGIVAASTQLPVLLFTLLGGAAADRFAKRNLLLVTQGLSITPALIIGILVSTGNIAVWHVITLSLAMGTINAFDIPTRQSFLVEMVERGNLLNAIALNSAAFNGARMIGPTLAGIFIARFGVAACFYINAASFVAVLVALARIRARGLPAHRTGTLLKDIIEGMRFVRRSPSVRRAMALVAVFSLFGLPFISQLPVFAEDILGKGAKGLGFLIGASGIGAFVAAVLLAFKGDIKNKLRAMATAVLVFPLCLIVFALSRNYALSLSLMPVAGLTVVVFLASANSFVQLMSPDGLRGRVMSVYTMVFLGMTPIGHSLMGVSADIIGASRAVALDASICLVLSVLILSRQRPAREEERGTV